MFNVAFIQAFSDILEAYPSDQGLGGPTKGLRKLAFAVTKEWLRMIASGTTTAIQVLLVSILTNCIDWLLAVHLSPVTFSSFLALELVLAYDARFPCHVL